MSESKNENCGSDRHRYILVWIRMSLSHNRLQCRQPNQRHDFEIRQKKTQSKKASSATMRAAKHVRPKVLLLENVKKLLPKKLYNGKKPLAFIRNRYRASGGVHHTARLCNLLRFLVPQPRRRAICLGTKHAAPQEHLSFDILRIFQRRRHFGWSKCLVGYDSGQKPQGGQKKTTKWVPKHDDWATQNGLHDLDAQAKRLSKLKQCKPKWHPVCTPRERSLLLLHSEKLTRSGIDVRKTKRLLQIDQEVDRSYPKDECVGCMTPAAKVYDSQEEKNVAAGQSRVSRLRRRHVEEVRCCSVANFG